MSSASYELNSQSQFIRAGAGAGKTTKLIETFLNFVRDFKKTNNRFPRVVMTTFTRKATQEVKERLLVSALDQNETEIFEYINKKSLVHISTIHGLLSVFLSQYADYIKYPQEIRIIDGPQFDKLVKRQINEIFKKNTKFLDLLEVYSFNDLVAISKKAVEFKSQSLKMSYVTKIELIALADFQRSQIVACIDELLRMTTEPLKGWIVYFEHLKMIRLSIVENQYTKLLELLDDFPAKPRWTESNPSLPADAHDLVLKLKDELLVDLYDSHDFLDAHETLNALFDAFLEDFFQLNLKRKRDTGELIISDLENLTLKLIDEYPEAAQEFSDTWDYFMIDEYQDTSPVQVKILNAFVRNKQSFIVGDPQQSIYLFRGARSEVFDIKQAEMKKAGASVDFLKINYRSEPSVMNFINDFFSNFSSQFKPMIPKSLVYEPNKLLCDGYYVKTQNQAAGVINHIYFLLNAGALPQDICILSRNNKNLDEISTLASKVGLNVQLQSASGFDDKREILDLICFNRFLYNPHDDENLIGLLRSPWFYLEEVELVKLAQSRTADGVSYWRLLTASSLQMVEGLKCYLDLFDSEGVLQATKHFIYQSGFIDLSFYYDRTGKREANIIKYLTTLSLAERQPGFSLGLFIEEQFQSIQIDSGSGNAEAQPVIRPDYISLMTIHASKGLQFKHVIIVGFADKPPNPRVERFSVDIENQKYSLSLYDEHEMKIKYSNWSKKLRDDFKVREAKENERVLYVAMTRAIQSLSLVADTSKRSDKNSWLSRVEWPDLGEVKKSAYTLKSVEYNEGPSINLAETISEVNVRPKYSEKIKAQIQSQSVTDLISNSGAPINDINYQVKLKNIKKAQYGTDLHRVFESLKYSDIERVITRLSVVDRKAVEYLFNHSEINFKVLLERGHNEWGFGLKTKSKFIQGQIDLWADLDSEFHLLDYKTGSSDYVDKAFEQLSFYTMALFSMNIIAPAKKIVHTIVYPVEETIRQKFFKNINDFRQGLSLKEVEQFDDIVGEK